MNVHILFSGKTYCNMPGIPSHWPEGHRWVPVDKHAEADCSTCLRDLLTGATICDRCHAIVVDGNGNVTKQFTSKSGFISCQERCS